MMRARAAVLWGTNQDWSVEEIEVDPPQAGEVLVEWRVAGLCHTDEHFVTGDLVPSKETLNRHGVDDFFPVVGGHEGAGIIAEVGPGVTSVRPGDHVSASFIPTCGRCRSCSSGRQHLCDLGARTLVKGMITDGTSRHRAGDAIPTLVAKLGTFADRTTVAEASVVKVDDDLPLEAVALVSCGVATGWGSACVRGDVRPGDTVVVVGIGGIGINAVQGARMAGAKHVVAVDPVELKREKAIELGASHAFASMEEALQPVADLTWGQMADKVILAPGVLYGELMASGTQLCGKGGTVVVAAIAPRSQTEASVNLSELALWNKEIKGTIFGSLNPRADIPKLLGLYRDGYLKVDELITNRYSLDQINDGYQAMRDGTNLRGVIVHG
jgi:S-(hydroxymethyl)glutathione dehydrogenase/alcohol dehydrogenase